MRRIVVTIMIVLFAGIVSSSPLDRRLSRASETGDVKTVEQALEYGASVDSKDVFSGNTPLIEAARNGNTGVVECLIRNKAGLDIPDKEGWTPLIHAIVNGRKKVVRLLIRKGADINCRDRMGLTPLMHTLAERDQHMAAIMIEAGADVSLTDSNEANALLYAIANELKESVRLLLEKGCERFRADRFGYDALTMAGRIGNKQILDLVKLRSMEKQTEVAVKYIPYRKNN